MASSLIKIASIWGGLSAAVTVGGSVAYFTIINNDTKKMLEIEKQTNELVKIKSHLSDLKLEIPDKDADNKKWNNQWETFKAEYQSKNLPDEWKIDGWTSLKEEANAPDKFKDKCIENGDKKINDIKQKIIEEVKAYCAIPQED